MYDFTGNKNRLFFLKFLKIFHKILCFDNSRQEMIIKNEVEDLPTMLLLGMPIPSTIDANKVSKVLFKATLLFYFVSKFMDVCMLRQVDGVVLQVDEVVLQVDGVRLQVDGRALQVVQNPKCLDS